MYLAYTDNPPVPSGETVALLCLSPENIHYICRNNVTLREFISHNGQVILRGEIDKDLVLTPFPQMKDFLNNRKE